MEKHQYPLPGTEGQKYAIKKGTGQRVHVENVPSTVKPGATIHVPVKGK